MKSKKNLQALRTTIGDTAYGSGLKAGTTKKVVASQGEQKRNCAVPTIFLVCACMVVTLRFAHPTTFAGDDD
jgi:hypothetical protein